MTFSENMTSIIVPFFNEEATLKQSVENLISEDFNKEIILVNDGSTDKSKEIAETIAKEFKYIKLIDNNKNRGKGFAVRLGIDNADGDLVGIYDADLEYSAADLTNLIKCIKNDNLDFVCGSRFIGDQIRKNIYFRTLYANKLLSLLFTYVYKNKITDIAVCLKVFKKEIIKNIDFEKDDFAIEVELIAKVLSKTNKYKELPISYTGRSYEEGKKIKLIDGLKYILAIFRYK
tara:strand:- start:27 stop:722 length:696 start_codon:yes stop_codon:yes gene_type:complete